MKYFAVLIHVCILKKNPKKKLNKLKCQEKCLFCLISSEEGCVTGMLQALELSSLEKHRSINRLIFMYKVVEGLVPAIPPEEFLKPAKTRRQIKGKQFKDHISHNIIDRHIINNDRGFVVETCKTEQLKNSFFVKTVIEWNHLSTETVRTKTVESFKQALSSHD